MSSSLFKFDLKIKYSIVPTRSRGCGWGRYSFIEAYGRRALAQAVGVDAGALGRG